MMTIQKLWTNLILFMRKLYVRLFEGKKNPFLMLTHPSETLEDLKYKRNGSRFFATLLLIAFSVSAIIKEVATGFIYSTLRLKDFNLLIVLCTSGFLVLLFVVGNWALCTLLNGEGRATDIYIMTCYNLIPLIVSNLFTTLMSRVLVEDEYVFVDIIAVCLSLWFIILMFYGAMVIHNYTFWGTFFNLIMSLVAMAIIFFLIFLFVVLVQQIYIFVLTIYTECRMRILR